jgi:hypothetical protein
MNLEEVQDDDVGIEKPKKRVLTEKQLANLANGRKSRMDKKTLEKASKIETKKVVPVVEPVVEPEALVKSKKTRKSQVIVFADGDTEDEEEDMPKIIIKQKRAPAKQQKPEPPREPSPPPPIPRLKRV